MSLVDVFSKEDRVPVTFTDFFNLARQAAKYEIVMNAVKCEVPYVYIREMATGKKEEDIYINPIMATTAPTEEEMEETRKGIEKYFFKTPRDTESPDQNGNKHEQEQEEEPIPDDEPPFTSKKEE